MNLKGVPESKHYTDDTLLRLYYQNFTPPDQAPPVDRTAWLQHTLSTLSPEEIQDIYKRRLNLNDIFLLRQLRSGGPGGVDPTNLPYKQQ